MTVREAARLLAGLPERWQDVEFIPEGHDEAFTLTGVDLFIKGKCTPVRVKLSSARSPTITVDGVVHPKMPNRVLNGR